MNGAPGSVPVTGCLEYEDVLNCDETGFVLGSLSFETLAFQWIAGMEKDLRPH